MRRRLEGRRSERGAALVEFALVIPFVFLLLMGTVDLGWAFFQHLDVRHGTREAARLASVNYRLAGGCVGACQRGAIVAEACDRMDGAGDVTVTLTLEDVGGGASDTDVGDILRVETVGEFDTLSGMLDFALDGWDLRSRVETRVEQVPTWAEGTTSC